MTGITRADIGLVSIDLDAILTTVDGQVIPDVLGNIITRGGE